MGQDKTKQSCLDTDKTRQFCLVSTQFQWLLYRPSNCNCLVLVWTSYKTIDCTATDNQKHDTLHYTWNIQNNHRMGCEAQLAWKCLFTLTFFCGWSWWANFS